MAMAIVRCAAQKIVPEGVQPKNSRLSRSWYVVFFQQGIDTRFAQSREPANPVKIIVRVGHQVFQVDTFELFRHLIPYLLECDRRVG